MVKVVLRMVVGLSQLIGYFNRAILLGLKQFRELTIALY